MLHVTVSERYPGSGEWIVHCPPSNSSFPMATFSSREEAEECAARINRMVEFKINSIKDHMIEAKIEALTAKMHDALYHLWDQSLKEISQS